MIGRFQEKKEEVTSGLFHTFYSIKLPDQLKSL